MSTAPGSEPAVEERGAVSLRSAGSTTPTPRTRGTSSSIIVFDPSTSQLSVRKRADLDTSRAIKVIPIPNRLDGHVDLYMNRHPGTDMSERLVATLYLGSLGWGARLRRWSGGIGEVYVLVVKEGVKAGAGGE